MCALVRDVLVVGFFGGLGAATHRGASSCAEECGEVCFVDMECIRTVAWQSAGMWCD